MINLADIYGPIQADLDKVEESLREVTAVDFSLLAQLLEYTLRDGGKRIRPALTLLCGKFYCYDLSLLVPMAMGVELLHTATLVHDDIVDNSPLRRGKPTVCRLWGENSALLFGDYLFARAGDLVASTGNLKVITLFAQALMTISGGELKQSAIVFDVKRARDYYYGWISAKTASLFTLATESGAVLSQAPEAVIQAMKSYGYNLGMAFQIVDDVLDFIGQEGELGKPVGSDLSEGAFTLPSILFAESYPDDGLIKRIACEKDAGSVALAVEKIRNSPAIDESLAIASDFCARARQTVAENVPDNQYRRSLLDLATFIIERKK